MSLNKTEIELLARQIRRDTIRMISHAGSGHPGGALGATELFAVLYGRTMRHGVDLLEDLNRDRLVLSNGHICAAWYSTLARFGYLLLEELAGLRRIGTRLQGHPSRVKLPGIVDNSSGPLGQGVPVAKGIAQANKQLGSSGHVFCIVGDGEMQEGIVWESLLSAAQHRVDNLTLIVSYNGLQIDGEVSTIKNIQPLADKFRAFGWHTFEVDGHDIDALTDVLRIENIKSGVPRAVVANTVMGKGVSFMENLAKWHGSCPSPDEVVAGLEEIGVAAGYDDFPIAAELEA